MKYKLFQVLLNLYSFMQIISFEGKSNRYYRLLSETTVQKVSEETQAKCQANNQNYTILTPNFCFNQIDNSSTSEICCMNAYYVNGILIKNKTSCSALTKPTLSFIYETKSEVNDTVSIVRTECFSGILKFSLLLLFVEILIL